MDICPSTLKSANLDEPGSKSTISLLSLCLGDVTSQASSKPSSVSFSSVESASLDTSALRELIVVKLKRTIFVSRLSCDNSVDDIKCFVKSKIMEGLEFGCYKMSSSLDSNVSSFKSYVADDKFGEFVNPAF